MITGAVARAFAIAGPLNGWPRSDLLSLATLLATIIPVLSGTFLLARRSIRPSPSKYEQWFAQTWGIFDNPYLGDKEKGAALLR